ncbi:ketosteroid isomerase family protein [Planktothrix mougeotii]|uniref:Nuclear transport factor 2 family protein n=1 Tax=Planktothrix mougeotii LEGE 06226 TaxID=1828728 RepID=A0ABR9UA42_9CYAN|nr:nuclear transport factor 2 family protein [Planktothrix mougeotii]MBE9143302.1 nuclear transport factor 2 family protein [Planktothrix mougeotii LEGE 06226]
MTTTPLDCQSKLSFDEVNAIAIIRYFESFNDEDFVTTASLFTPNGKLYAPFSELITGQEAIQNYLETEAKGMKLKPNTANSQYLENGQQLIQIFGEVKTSLFTVNVGWQFRLTEQEEIEEVIVKLLASALELLKISNQ